MVKQYTCSRKTLCWGSFSPSFINCHPCHKMAFGICCANRIKCLRAKRGECEKPKISAPTNCGIGFCETVHWFVFNGYKFNFFFLLREKSSDFLSTLYIFACKRMLPGTVLKVNEHREVGEEAGVALSGAEPHASFIGNRAVVSAACGQDLESSVFALRGAPVLGTPSHRVPLESPSSMLPHETPCMPCCTPHSNTVRETVGRGTGDRRHCGAGLMSRLLWWLYNSRKSAVWPLTQITFLFSSLGCWQV